MEERFSREPRSSSFISRAHAATIGRPDVSSDIPRLPSPTVFWCPTQYRMFDDIATVESISTRGVGDKVWRDVPDGERIEHVSLASPTQVLTALRRNTTVNRITDEVDIDPVVQRLAAGDWSGELPKRQRKRWGSSIHVIVDRAHRLIPYWRDQDDTTEFLKELYPHYGVRFLRLDEGRRMPQFDGGFSKTRVPPADVPILAVTDLGALDLKDEAIDIWETLGRKFCRNGNKCIALTPCRADSIPISVRRYWQVVEWEPSNRDPRRYSSHDALRNLLPLIAPATEVTPGLLREIRRLSESGRRDAGLESLVWQRMASKNVCLAGMPVKMAAQLREQFAGNSDLKLKLSIMNCIRRHCTDSSGSGAVNASAWFETLLDADEPLRAAIGDLFPRDIEDAQYYVQSWAKEVDEITDEVGRITATAWSYRFAGRVRRATSRDPVVGESVRRLRQFAHRPGGSSEASTLNVVRTVAITHEANCIRFGDAASGGSPIGRINTCDDRLEVIDAANEFGRLTKSEFPPNHDFPEWASEVGCDQYGYFACFTVRDVTQRMRWISPGTFLMGSPEDEDGRYDDEGPQHEVTISNGFWLFDTPCTQELWVAVMGNNPSLFKGDRRRARIFSRRPVESVSCGDCDTFHRMLAILVPGLNLELPAEAEWEFACRAGMNSATYAGKVQIDIENEIPKVLDQIVWFRSNSNGHTHDVGEKKPNDRGLYDMLGSVFEWCRDGKRVYTEDPVTDPIGSSAPVRVIRGGSWSASAGLVRAGYRHWVVPSLRYQNLGFRSASSGKGAEPWVGSERAVQGRSELVEPRGDSEPASEDRWINLAASDAQLIATPSASKIRIVSDIEELVVERITRPEWASNMGRDEFGLWTEFKIDDVKQRMRWIPPGRFTMGSPKSEKGRFDEWEQDPHEEIVESGFWLFDTPCTQELWSAIMKDDPSEFKGGRRPVENVSWNDCQKFLENLSRQLRGIEFTLPAEANWEYACRAGTNGPIWSGETQVDDPQHAQLLDDIAWYSENSKSESHDVGLKAANPWGLCDMLGNVWEWCADTPSADSANRVLRGGSWGYSAGLVRAAYRNWSEPSSRLHYLGFRCSTSGKPAERRTGTGQVDVGYFSAE